MLLSSSDARVNNTDAFILVYKHRPERTGFNIHAENTQQQLTFLALLPWPKTKFWTDFCLTNQTKRSTVRPKIREKG